MTTTTALAMATAMGFAVTTFTEQFHGRAQHPCVGERCLSPRLFMSVCVEIGSLDGLSTGQTANTLSGSRPDSRDLHASVCVMPLAPTANQCTMGRHRQRG